MARQRSRPWPVLVAAVAAGSLLALLRLEAGDLYSSWVGVTLLGLLAAFLGERTVRLPRLATPVAPAGGVTLAALAWVSPLAAALVALLGVVGGVLGAAALPDPPRLVGRLGRAVLAAVVAGWGFAVAGGRPGGAPDWLALVVAGALQAAVGGALGRALRDQAPQRLGRRQRLAGAAAAVLVPVLVAASLLLVAGSLGLWSPLLALAGAAALVLVARFRRLDERCRRLDERERRLERVTAEKLELERLVGDRTRALSLSLARLGAANRQLGESDRRLQAASRSQRDFLARVSHELKTPLNAVLGFSELLADPRFGPLGAEQGEFLADIRASGEHLLGLIDDILDLARIDAGKMEARRQPTRLDRAIAEVAALCKPQARAKAIALAVACPAEVAVGEVEPGMFREVVTNLLSNAVKFTPTGGRVRVEVRAEGRDLLLSVEDTGIGIPEDEQERVFEEFYQVDRLHTRRHPGSGLGLTLVRRLVELHGGSVSVESTPGIGSCFTCRFPDCLRDAPAPGGLDAAPAAGPDAAPAGAMPSRLLLIVGGPRLDRKLMRNALRARGYRLLEADDAAEALDRLRGAERPDLALVDVDLEASHGLELIERLRLDPAAAGIPAAVVGSAADPDLLARARAAGAVGCLPKPLRLNRLPAEVERLIAAAAAAAVA